MNENDPTITWQMIIAFLTIIGIVVGAYQSARKEKFNQELKSKPDMTEAEKAEHFKQAWPPAWTYAICAIASLATAFIYFFVL